MMDDEMINKIIKASFEAWNKQRGLNFTLDDMSYDEKEWAKIHAIEIVKAMRKPTKNMCYAGDRDAGNANRAKATWQAMIDAVIE